MSKATKWKLKEKVEVEKGKEDGNSIVKLSKIRENEMKLKITSFGRPYQKS